MEYQNKFEDGQKVRIIGTPEIVTVNRWAYAPKMKRYTYTVIESPPTFYFEHELESV